MTGLARAAALLLLFSAAGPARPAEDDAAVHRVFQFKLERSALDRLCSEMPGAGIGRRAMSLPHFRMFRADGALAWEVSGYSTTFYRELRSRAKSGEAAERDWRLDDEVADFVAEDKSRVSTARLPPADVTLVAYWAAWCAPCKKQIADLRRFTEEVAELTANVLLIEADPQWLPSGKAFAACASSGKD